VTRAAVIDVIVSRQDSRFLVEGVKLWFAELVCAFHFDFLSSLPDVSVKVAIGYGFVASRVCLAREAGGAKGIVTLLGLGIRGY